MRKAETPAVSAILEADEALSEPPETNAFLFIRPISFSAKWPARVSDREPGRATRASGNGKRENFIGRDARDVRAKVTK